ncbi:AbrB/MazE/SpoVT family DNA-binding domain-containing protein [Candidatus Woesearchaeota archaeon]|nr:AbrB/MazE/SpoVT family DNA-binding domain-containing protein [Candidatus Woesearchaeota archaeon]
MADITKISTKGQVVIPNELRKQLGISEGDTLQIEKVGKLLVLKKIELSSLAKELGGSNKRGGQK